MNAASLWQVAACYNAHIALALDPTAFDSAVYEVSLAQTQGGFYHDVVIRDGVNGNVVAQTPGASRTTCARCDPVRDEQKNHQNLILQFWTPTLMNLNTAFEFVV